MVCVFCEIIKNYLFISCKKNIEWIFIENGKWLVWLIYDIREYRAHT